MELRKPYLLFLGASQSLLDCKTAAGLRDWCRDAVIEQTALPGCTVDLGLAWCSPAEAYAALARSLIIGVAPTSTALCSISATVRRIEYRNGLMQLPARELWG